jgi:hypothetical protein
MLVTERSWQSALVLVMAEDAGFEPARGYQPQHDFQDQQPTFTVGHMRYSPCSECPTVPGALTGTELN